MAPHFTACSFRQIGVSAKFFLTPIEVRRHRPDRVVRFLGREAGDLNIIALSLLWRSETKEINASEERGLSSQCLCGSPQRCCRKASVYFAAQSETRSAEALRLCRDDGNSRRPSIRKSQERLQICLGRSQIRRATYARALRTSEPDAI